MLRLDQIRQGLRSATTFQFPAHAERLSAVGSQGSGIEAVHSRATVHEDLFVVFPGV